MANEKKEVLTLNELINEKENAAKKPVKKQSLAQIAKNTSSDNSTLKEVDLTKIKAKKPVEAEDKPEMAQMMDRLDAAMERKKKEFKERVDKAKAEIIEGRLNGELKLNDAPADEKQNAEPININLVADTEDKVEDNQEPINLNNNDDINIDDMLKELEDSDEVLDDDEINQLVKDKAERKDGELLTKNIINALKPKVKAVLMPNKDEVDFSKFKIATRTVAYSKVLSIFPDNNKHYSSTWVLPNTGIPITVRELTGTEIELLAAAYARDNNLTNRINAMRRMYAIIYSHIIDPNKPSSMEEWLKTISYLDMNHLSFALYKSSFENTNYLPYVCPNEKCHEADLVKVDINDMIEFKNEEIKKKFYDILQKDPTSKGNKVEEHLIQISNEFAVGVRVPSIYTLVFENIVLDETFRNKYNQILGYISFIGNIYKIDRANSELIAVDTKPDKDDFRKTVKNKIIIYTKILSQLSSDEYNNFELAVDKYSNLKADEFNVKYVTPAHICTKCKTEIPKAETDPMNLVFQRHRLIREID